MRALIGVVMVPMIAVAQLRVSGDRHYLYEKQSGQPVFLNGESVWCLFTAITYTEAEEYFQNCEEYGINFLQTCLIEDGFTQTSSGWGSPNRNGDRPFVGNTFTNRNASYFAHCDSIIGLAKRYGIYVHAYISYLGAGSYEGWQTEIGGSSIADMKSWGTYIGNRYKDSTNLMWGISGDCDPTPWRQKLDSMSLALLSQDTNHLLVPRDNPWTVTQTHWSGRAWLKVEYIYPYWGPQEFNPERIYQAGWTAYNSARPAFLEEAWYENEWITTPPTNGQLRTQMYYGPLSGAFVGQVFGNCPIWHFGAGHNSVCGPGTYQSWLDSPGHVSVGWCGRLFRNRNWWTLVPDQSGVVLTSGAGTGANRAVCSYTSDSTSIMVYMPTARQITVTSARLKGDSTHAWWFNPSNGVTIDLGIQTRAPHSYTPASGDWVLVLDAKVMNYPAPGVELPSTPPPPPVLAAPPNGATGVATNPTLTWNTSTGAVSYRLQVSQDSAWGTTVIDQSGVMTSSYQANGLANNARYFWRVNAANRAGASSFSAVWRFTTTLTTVDDKRTPTVFRLNQTYPDPFNPSTTITFDLPYASFVTLEIFNAAGQKVRTLLATDQSPASYSVTWDGRDDRGQRVSSGIYLYRARTDRDSVVRKMLLLK
jgi:hypothetical protein